MQKEQLSALMDGETLDSELLNELAHNPEMQKTWESYHLIRDSMRGDTPEVLHFDISSRVMAAIEEEPVRQPATLIPEAQPAPHQWQKMPFWQKVRPWAAQLTQMGVAACVSLAVIVGVQHYNGQSETSQQPETPVFNTLPMMGKASPVSLGVPSEATANNGQQQQVQEQRRRINAMSNFRNAIAVMKQLWFAMSLVTGSLLFSANASATPASGALLQQMNLASQSLNYELSFISINKQGVESLRYRHARLDNRPLAQLLQMDGPRREVVQRGNEISYFEPGLEPFTLNGDYIVDSLPSLIYTDFKRLSPYYDFISVGRTRIADRLCEVIRVVARDGTRYSYIVWMDTESKLPMRVDLLDRDGETLEQFRVIAFNVNQDISSSMQTLAKANLPPLLSVPVGEKAKFSWTPTWLPQGFSEVSSSRRPLPTMDNMPIESRLYSDGLFSFSVNVNRATQNRQYKRT